MMYIDNEVLEKMIMTIVEGFDRIEKKLDRMGRVKEFLNGDELLDNYDIARLLNVSLRTVARYREKGLIRYYQTDENGKNFYRSSDIQVARVLAMALNWYLGNISLRILRILTKIILFHNKSGISSTSLQYGFIVRLWFIRMINKMTVLLFIMPK